LVIIRLIHINLRPESYNQTNITMKKVFAVLAIASLTTFVACGPKAEEAATDATENVTESVDAAASEATEATEAAVDTAAAAAGAMVDSTAAAVAQ